LLSKLRHSDPEQREGEESNAVEIIRPLPFRSAQGQGPQNNKRKFISQNDFVVYIHILFWTRMITRQIENAASMIRKTYKISVVMPNIIFKAGLILIIFRVSRLKDSKVAARYRLK